MRNEVMAKVVTYKKLNEMFLLFCKNFAEAFSDRNEYGIEAKGSSPVERDLLIFNHPGKIEFGFKSKLNTLSGLISFYRIVNNKNKLIAQIYFDNLGNWGSDLTEEGWSHSFSEGCDYTNHLSVVILNGFFNNPEP